MGTAGSKPPRDSLFFGGLSTEWLSAVACLKGVGYAVALVVDAPLS